MEAGEISVLMLFTAPIMYAWQVSQGRGMYEVINSVFVASFINAILQGVTFPQVEVVGGKWSIALLMRRLILFRIH
jgi:hypothetical protein